MDNSISKGNNSNPLVSIIVITYNSSKFVLETLESAKAQTYQNIELIISDDSSKDDTVEICRNWLAENKDRFVRTELITVPENTGIPANCNRGVRASKGEWVKLIAGDDVLLEECIQYYIDFINTDPNIKYCYSDFDKHLNDFSSESLVHNEYRCQQVKKYGKLSCDNQLNVLIYDCLIPAPTTFINTEKFEEIGLFDETYWFVEDVTTWYNVLNSGEKFHFIDKKTVKYRLHSNSITKKSSEFEISNQLFLIQRVVKDRFYSHFTLIEKLLFNYKYYYLKKYKNKRKKNLLSMLIRRILYQPILFEQKLKNNKVRKILKNN